MKLSVVVGTLCVSATVGQDPTVHVVQSSAAGDTWTKLNDLKWGPDFTSDTDVTVNASVRYQTILGFGAAFTDTSAYNWVELMNATTQQQFLRAHWDVETGLGYTLGRVPINSPDYALISFNYDNVTDDFGLEHFDTNVTYDTKHVIPFIKAARAFSRDPIKLYASPWSPPGWFKTNNNMISSLDPCLKNDTANGSYAQSWANYFVKWFKAFEAHGIDFWGVTPQNEPLAIPGKYEGCHYDADAMRLFIKNHLGPTLKGAYPDINIMIYDHNKVAALDYVLPTFQDPDAAQYIDGTAVHWYDYGSNTSFGNLEAIHALNTSKFILNTEACWLQLLQYGWNVGAMYALDILGDINHWAVGWVDWNPVVHSGFPAWMEGGPTHDNSTHFGSPSIFFQFENGTESLAFQSTYWTMGHISKYARPGSVRVGTSGQGVASTDADYNAIRAMLVGQQNVTNPMLVASSFISADNSTGITVVLNSADSPVTFKLRDASKVPFRAVNVTMPAASIRTFTFQL